MLSSFYHFPIFTSYILQGDFSLKRLKLFFINTVVLTLTSFLLHTIGVSFNVYISGKIGTEAVGLFSLVMSIYLFAVTIAKSGINLATTRLVSEELAQGNTSRAKKVTQKCILFSFLTGAIASFLLFVFSDSITKVWLHSRITPKCLHIVCIALPFISMSSAVHGYFTAVRRVYKPASCQFFEQFVKIGLTAYFLNLLFPPGLEYACLSLILGDVISEVCSFAYIYLLYRLDSRRYHNHSRAQGSDSRRIFRIAVPVALTSYIRSGLSTIKQVLIPSSLEKSGLSCSDALSGYGMVTGMAMPVLMFPSVLINAISNLLVPEFSRYRAKQDYKRVKEICILLFKVFGIFSIILTVFFLLFAEKLSVWMYQNAEVAVYIKLLAPLLFFMYLDTIVDSILKGLDAQVSVMLCNIIDLLVSIFLIYFMVPILGLPGYLLVICVSEILNFTISTGKLVSILRHYT